MITKSLATLLKGFQLILNAKSQQKHSDNITAAIRLQANRILIRFLLKGDLNADCPLCLCYGALAHLSRHGELKPACVLEPFTLSRSKSDLKLPPESGFAKTGLQVTVPTTKEPSGFHLDWLKLDDGWQSEQGLTPKYCSLHHICVSICYGLWNISNPSE